MLPVLLNLGFIKIYTFGVFLVLAFFWGAFLLWKLIRLTSFKEEEVFDGLFLGLAGGLFFGRLVYVILNFKDFGLDILKFVLINGYPGLSLYGAIAGGCLALMVFFSFKKIPVAQVLDYFASPMFLALAFGKLGSFFSGAEVGSKTKFILSAKYVNFEGTRHLTAFYESLFFFLAAFFAFRLLFEIRKEMVSKGINFYFFVWYFSAVFLLFDKLKAHHLYWLTYSVNYLVSLILFLTTTIYFLYYFKGSILKGTMTITNFLKSYGQKTYQKVYHFAKRKIRTRTKEDSPKH